MCVYVCVAACVSACVRACLREGERQRLGVAVCISVQQYSTCKTYLACSVQAVTYVAAVQNSRTKIF